MDWREEQYILQNIKTMSLERLKYFIFSFCPWRKQAQKQKTKTVVGSQKKFILHFKISCLQQQPATDKKKIRIKRHQSAYFLHFVTPKSLIS